MILHILAVLAIAMATLTQFEVPEDVLILENHVALPVSRIAAFKYISDLSSLSMWYPGTESFDPADGTPINIGKHYKETNTLPMIGEVIYDNIVTGYESPRFISIISDSLMAPRVDISIERSENQQYPSRLSWKLMSRRRNYLVYYIMAPVWSMTTGPTVRQALFNLRHVLYGV